MDATQLEKVRSGRGFFAALDREAAGSDRVDPRSQRAEIPRHRFDERTAECRKRLRAPAVRVLRIAVGDPRMHRLHDEFSVRAQHGARSREDRLEIRFEQREIADRDVERRAERSRACRDPIMRHGLEASSATGPRRFDQRCAGIDADDFASVGRQRSGQPAFAAPDVDHAARTLAQHRLHDRGIRAGTAARDLSFAHRIRPRRRIAIPAPLHARGGIVDAFARIRVRRHRQRHWLTDRRTR